MVYRPLEVIHAFDGDDEHCRRQFSLNDFAEMEQNSYLDVLFYYWNALRGDGRELPRVESFCPTGVFGPDVLHWIRGVDTTSENPENFLLRDHHSSLPALLPNGLHGRPVTDFPSKAHARATLRDYVLCRRLRSPMYHEINQVVCGVPRHYVRLLLPLVDANGRVVRLAYGSVVRPLAHERQFAEVF